MQRNKGTRFGLACAAAVLLTAASNPALALDDDGSQSLFKTFTGILGTGIGIPGITPDDPKPAINYRERPPLVLPKTQTLRAPLPPVAQRNRAWPKDYDKELARRARPGVRAVERDEAGNEILSAKYLRDTGRLARNPRRNPEAEDCENRGPLDQPCNVTKLWTTLKNARKADETKDLLPGVEPRRQALTDPPPGLRTPSRRVRATWEAPPEDPGGVPDPRKAIRDEAKREDQYR